MGRLYRFVIENSLYEIERGRDLHHWSDGTKFTYVIDYKSVKPVVGVLSDNAPNVYYLGYIESGTVGEQWTYPDPSWNGRDLTVWRFESDIWKTVSWKRIGSEVGWEIYKKPSGAMWVLMAMPTSRSSSELMVVPLECNIWRVYTRDVMIGGGVITPVEPVKSVEGTYATIKHKGSNRRVLLVGDYPFNPDFYLAYGSSEGWPLYSISGKQWKVSYDIGDPNRTAVFTEVGVVDVGEISSAVVDIGGGMPLKWTNIVQNGIIWRVVLRDGSPFDPNDWQVYDVDADGWPIFLVNGVEWVVKVGHDDASVLPFAKFERRIVERPVDAVVDTIYRNGVAVDVELGLDAPFIPSQQTVAGVSYDGWPEYNIGGRLWKVSSDHGMAVFTEMTWPVVPTVVPSEVPSDVPSEMTDGSAIVVVADKPAGDDTVILMENSYVPFVVLVGLLGIFSIAAQRK